MAIIKRFLPREISESSFFKTSSSFEAKNQNKENRPRHIQQKGEDE